MNVYLLDCSELIRSFTRIGRSLKLSLTRAYSWLSSHGSVVLLVLFLSVLADILARQVTVQLLGEWSFWTLVSFWIAVLLLTARVSRFHGRIRRSIRLAIYLGGPSLVLVVILVGYVLRMSDLFWSAIVGMFTFFSMAQFYEVLENASTSRILPPVSTTLEDQAILSKAQELSRKLGVSGRFNPLYVTWVSNVYSDEVAFEDEFQKRNILLPLSLKNKLSPEELSVLIAAFLVDQTGLRKSVVLYSKFFLPLIIYIIVFIEETPALVSIPYAVLAGELGYVLIASIMMVFLLAQIKKRCLANDLLTARLVGKELFLAVLKKIDNLELQDMQRLAAKRDIKARLSSRFKPSLEERMENLMRH